MAVLTRGQTERLAAAVRSLGAYYPAALCTLRGADSEFTLLMGLLLTSRTRTEVAEQALARLMCLARTPEQIAKIGIERIFEAITGVAYPATKAGRLVQLSFALIEQHSGRIPDQLTELEDLPGIGPKIAHLFLNLARNEPTIAVDCHVLRLCQRVIGGSSIKASALGRVLASTLDTDDCIRVHHWISQHARTVCRAHKPKCGVCQIANHCLAMEKTAPEKRSTQ